MKRRLVLLLLLLVGGAIINVAVAWGIALRLPPPIQSDSMAQLPFGNGRVIIQRRAGDVRVSAHSRGKSTFLDNVREIDESGFERMLPYGSVFHNSRWIDDQLAAAMAVGGTGALIEHSHGWPIVAMAGWLTIAYCDGRTSIVARSGLKELGPITLGPFSTAPLYRRLLPLRPLWPGFAIDMLFYAAILWLLFAAPFTLRRRRRIKRGLCPKCGYPIGSSEVCTECGTPHLHAMKPKPA